MKREKTFGKSTSSSSTPHPRHTINHVSKKNAFPFKTAAVSFQGRELSISRDSCCEAEAAAVLCAQLPN